MESAAPAEVSMGYEELEQSPDRHGHAVYHPPLDQEPKAQL